MDDFTIQLGSITNGKNSFSFKIKDEFFETFTFSGLEHANISALATLDKDGENLSLNLIIKGEINNLSCDICTEELSVQITGQTDIIIKRSDADLISTDEIFYIKQHEKKIDLKHLIFELIVLNLPKKRKHTVDKQGKSTCNKEMVDLVNKYTQIKEQASDPRWDALKKIKIKL